MEILLFLYKLNVYLMKDIVTYLLEKKDSKDEKTKERGNIKFTIWKEPDKKVTWLEDGESYLKIEYKYVSDDKNINVDFLLGYVKKENTWKYWMGKIGSLSYDDDPYCDLETPKFSEAIVKALDKTQEFVKDIKDNPDNWIQFYKDL